MSFEGLPGRFEPTESGLGRISSSGLSDIPAPNLNKVWSFSSIKVVNLLDVFLSFNIYGTVSLSSTKSGEFKVFKNLNPTNEELTPLKILKHMHNKKEFQSDFISGEDIRYLKENISEYFFEKGEMVMNEHNISDIVFLKKNA